MQNTQVETFKVGTPRGVIELPVDKNWGEYTAEQRRRIKCAVDRMMKCMEIHEVRDSIVRFSNTTADYCYLTFEEAKVATDSYVVMEGDWGGQHYIICPMRLIKCTEEALLQLLKDIDEVEWPCNKGDGIDIVFQRLYADTTYISSCNGASILDGPWIGVSEKLKPYVEQVLNGEIPAIPKEVLGQFNDDI